MPHALRRPARPLLVFAATVATLIVAGQIAVRRVPGLTAASHAAPTVHYPDTTWYLAFNGGTQLDHWVLYHGFGSSMRAARAADVLVLGTSHSLFGFPSAPLREFEERRGVNIFHLGLGAAEPYLFPMEIIRTFDLRPKLAIVNTDHFFFDEESRIATQVRGTSRWLAAQRLFEERVSSVVKPWLTAVFPRFLFPPIQQYLLRSSTTGSWRPINWPHDDRLFTDTHLPAEVSKMLPAAQRLKAELDARGTQLVLTCVPGWRVTCTPVLTRRLARALGVPAIVPRLAGLKLGDISHLCPGSGRRFARAFLRRLARSPEFEAITRR